MQKDSLQPNPSFAPMLQHAPLTLGEP